MSELKDTSMRISGTRRLKLEKAALEITIAKEQVTKMTDVVNYMIDNYLKDAKEDMKQKR